MENGEIKLIVHGNTIVTVVTRLELVFCVINVQISW